MLRDRIPFWPRADRGDSPPREAYRRLTMQLRADLGDLEAGRCIALVSPRSPRTCAAASVQLAFFLADEYQERVLLIDGSRARLNASRILRAGSSVGLLDVLEGRAAGLDELLVDAGREGVSLLPLGTPDGGVSRTLVGNALKAFLAEVRSRYDSVLLHCGPLLDDSTALAFAAVADVVLLLAVDGQTKRNDLEESRRKLEAVKATRVSVVLTSPARRRWCGWLA